MTAAALVLCAGIPRSGSTWLYNAARLLLMRHAGVSSIYGAWIAQYDSSNTAPWHVIKIHDPDEGLLWRARVAFTSRRDLRDIAASAWKRGWVGDEPTTIAFLDNVVAQHTFWRDRCAHQMTYEQMLHDRPAELARIANALNLPIDSAALRAISNDIDSLGFDDSREGDFDTETLLHKRHIIDGRPGSHAHTLPADVVATINQRYGDWLRANAYAI